MALPRTEDDYKRLVDLMDMLVQGFYLPLYSPFSPWGFGLYNPTWSSAEKQEYKPQLLTPEQQSD